MCTVTVHRVSASLTVTMNRDERRARGPESPPEAFRDLRTGTSWIMPRDGDGGGTWIAANGRGLVACLLNAYGFEPHGSRPCDSRGRVVPQVIRHGNLSAALDWINRAFNPSSYAPFTLVLVSSSGGRCFTWTGSELLSEELPDRPWWMITSSSWNSDAVVEWRQERFDEWLREGAALKGLLPSFHFLQVEGWLEWSPRMARNESRTFSISQASLHGAAPRLAFRCWPNPETGALPKEPEHHLEMALGEETCRA